MACGGPVPGEGPGPRLAKGRPRPGVSCRGHRKGSPTSRRECTEASAQVPLSGSPHAGRGPPGTLVTNRHQATISDQGPPLADGIPALPRRSGPGPVLPPDLRPAKSCLSGPPQAQCIPPRSCSGLSSGTGAAGELRRPLSSCWPTAATGSRPGPDPDVKPSRMGGAWVLRVWPRRPAERSRAWCRGSGSG